MKKADLEAALEEIRELTVNPPDAVVAIELIQQVLRRVEYTQADSALERLARCGALDDLSAAEDE